MKLKNVSLLGLIALIVGSGCNKNEVDEKLSLHNRTVAYTPVTETPTTRVVNTSVLENIVGSSTISFDSHQAWFDFTTINSTNKGKASLREAWHLGFWNGTGEKVILNYSVTTQASQLPGVTTFPSGLAAVPTTALESAHSQIVGGPLGMGALSTFDFHRDNQFVIGTPASNKVFLLKTLPVKKHPDSTATVSLWVVTAGWSGTQYQVQYRAVTRTSATSWAWATPSASKSFNLSKTGTQQYNYAKLTVPTATATELPTIQPTNANWNLGLSAVTLKRYMSDATAYAFSLKGVVLNNNSGVEIYRVQKTAATAGAPGPYDPNYGSYTAATDPALNPANSISTWFNNYNSDSIKTALFSKVNQEEIGQYYRRLDMGNVRIFVDRFYVIKTSNGHVYKLKFDRTTTNASGEDPVNDGIKYTYAKIATP